MTVPPSLWLDSAPAASRAAALQASAKAAASGMPSWVLGTVTATSADDTSLPAGWVRVAIPADDPVSEATGMSDGGLSAIGATVRVTLDATGRVVGISSPITLPEDSDTVATGALGERISAAMTQAAEAYSQAAAIRERAQQAVDAAEQAMTQAADALRAAEGATGAVVSAAEPEEPAEGQIWYQLDTDSGQTIVGVKIRVGDEWVARPLVAEQVLVPGSVGTVALQDGAVTASKVTASEELWAKVAAFGSVTTDMLTAGGATITGTAVVGDLVGNTLRGGRLELTAQDDAINTFYVSPTDWSVFEGSDRQILLTTTDSTGALFQAAAIGSTLSNPTTNTAGIQCALDTGTTGSFKNCVMTFVVTSSIAQTVFVMWRVNGSWKRASYSVAANTSTALTLNYKQTTLPDAIRIVPAGAAAHTITLTTSEVRLVFNENRSTLDIDRNNGGQPVITLTAPDGATAVLSPTGAAYTPADTGTQLGEISWRHLIAPPIGYMRNPNNQSIVNNTWAVGNIVNGAMRLSGGMTNAGSRLVVPETGYYRITGRTKFASNAAGKRGVGFSVNAGATDVYSFAPPVSGTNTVECNTFVALNAGDTVALMLFQNSGVTLNSPERELSIQYVTSL